jgi:hypothetical protein
MSNFDSYKNALKRLCCLFIDALWAGLQSSSVAWSDADVVNRRLGELNDPEFERRLVESNPTLFH